LGWRRELLLNFLSSYSLLQPSISSSSLSSPIWPRGISLLHLLGSAKKKNLQLIKLVPRNNMQYFK
jgi:hypothetical protein